MTTSCCKYYTIDYGESLCLAVADRLSATTPEQIKQYARPTLCAGQKAVCEFKKFGVKNNDKMDS